MQSSEKWALLQSINDWIKYSDAKAGLVLAFQGAVVGFFFAQRANFTDLAVRYGWLAQILFGFGILGLAVSIFFAASSVYPRLKVGESKSNIFFAHIGQLPSADDYRRRLSKPLLPFETEIEEQIWANSVVAWKKYKHVSRSIGIGIVSSR